MIVYILIENIEKDKDKIVGVYKTLELAQIVMKAMSSGGFFRSVRIIEQEVQG